MGNEVEEIKKGGDAVALRLTVFLTLPQAACLQVIATSACKLVCTEGKKGAQGWKQCAVPADLFFLGKGGRRNEKFCTTKPWTSFVAHNTLSNH